MPHALIPNQSGNDSSISDDSSSGNSALLIILTVCAVAAVLIAVLCVYLLRRGRACRVAGILIPTLTLPLILTWVSAIGGAHSGSNTMEIQLHPPGIGVASGPSKKPI